MFASQAHWESHAAGPTALHPPADMPYGDRMGTVRGPLGERVVHRLPSAGGELMITRLVASDRMRMTRQCAVFEE